MAHKSSIQAKHTVVVIAIVIKFYGTLVKCTSLPGHGINYYVKSFMVQ